MIKPVQVPKTDQERARADSPWRREQRERLKKPVVERAFALALDGDVLALTWRMDFGSGVLFKVPFRAPETLAGWAAVVGADSARAAARVQPQRL